MEISADVLWESLTANELKHIPIDARQKVEDNFRNEIEGIKSLKEEFEKLKATSEQDVFILEKQLTDAHKQITELKADLSQQKKENLELLKDYDPLKTELQNSKNSLKKLENEFGILKSDKEFLKKEKQDLFDLLERRNSEIQRLNAQVESLARQLNESNSAKCEIIAKYNDIVSKEASLEQKEKFFNQERDGFNRQIEFLNNQLEEANKQITFNNSQHAKVLMESQLHLTELSEENEKLKDDMNFLKQEKDKANEINMDLTEKLKDAREFTSKMEENYLNELRTQSQLAQLHEESLEDEKAKCKEISQGAEELRRLLKESSAMYGELEEKLSETGERFQISLAEKDEIIESLRKELDVANALVDFAKKKGFSDEGIESLSPAAASACKILKSGMSLTQIYSEYVKISEELFKEKQKNNDLHSYLEQILKEFQEKAPVLKQQRLEYSDAMESISTLTSQLNAAVRECDQLKFENSDYRRNLNQSRRECHRQQVLNKDLRSQVCLLLKEIERFRDKSFDKSTDIEVDQDLSQDGSGYLTCDKLISSELVTFKNIEELQEQNQKLLTLLRQETEDRENQEQQTRDFLVQKLQNELEAGLNEIKELKSQREYQNTLVDNLVLQRDALKSVIQGNAKIDEKMVTSTPIVGGPANHVNSGNNSLLDTSTSGDALATLQKEFESYKTEKCQLELRFKEDLQSLRTDLEKERISKSKLETDLEYSQEKAKVSVKNLDIYRNQISALEEKCQKLNKNIGSQERTIAMLKEEMVLLQQKYAKAEARCESLQEEKILLKQNEARYSQERESRAREQNLHVSLMSTFEMIKNNLEKKDFEAKMKLENQNEFLQKELTTLRRKADHDFEQYKESVRTWEKDCRDMRNQLDSLKTKEQKTQEELMNSYTMVHKLESEVQELKQKLNGRSHCMEESIPPPSPHLSNLKDLFAIPNDKRCDELELKLKEATAVIDSLKSEIDSCKNHTEIFKNMSENLEKELRESNANIDSIKAECDKKCQECLTHQVKLQEKIEGLEKERQSLFSENNKLNREVMATTGDLRIELNAALAELESTKISLCETENKLQSLTTELSEQTKLAVDASQKYERELISHAESVEKLTEAKNRLLEVSNKFEALEQEKINAYEKLKFKEEAWAVTQSVIKEDNKNLQERIHELDNINNCLHHQVEVLSVKLNSITATEDKNFEDLPELCSSDQLLQLNIFLKKEKDILKAKLEHVEAEKVRNECKAENLQKRLDEANQSLAKLSEDGKAQALTTSQHAELLRKVELVQTLTDSNRALREEKNRLASQCEQAVSRLQSMESTYPSLESNNKELTTKVTSLEIDVDVLRNEVARWQQRTNQLAEKASKASVEDMKKLLTEKDQLLKQSQLASEEAKKMNTERIKAENALKVSQNETIRLRNLNLQYHEENKKKVNELENQIKQLEDNCAKTHNELKAAKADCSKKEAELNRFLQETNVSLKNKDDIIQQKIKQLAELQKSIVQVRKIGRKYKSQYEELNTKFRSLENKPPKGMEETEREAAGDAVNIETEDQMGMGDEGVDESQESKVQEYLDKIKELQEMVAAKDLEMANLTSEIEELKCEITNPGGPDKDERSRKVLQTARQKIQELSHKNSNLIQEKNKLTKELQDVLSKQESNESEEQLRMFSLKSQYEGKINKLEKEVQELQHEKARLMEQINSLTEEKEQMSRVTETLQHKLTIQQKQLENYQKQLSVQGSKSCQSVSSSEPPTANIKPLAAATQPPATRPQTAQASHSITPSKMTPTASIRPIAMTTPQHSRMATVMPNSQHQVVVGVSLPSEAMMTTVQSTETSYNSGLPQATVQPTPASRRREDGMEDSTVTMCVTPQVQVQQLTSSQSASAETNDVPEEPVQQSHAVAMVPPQQQQHQPTPTIGSSESSSDVVAASSSSACVLVVPAVKRSRESDSEGSSGSSSKRPRTTSENRDMCTIEISIGEERSQSPMSSHLEDTPQIHTGSGAIDRSENEEDDDDDVIVIGSEDENLDEEAKTDDQEENEEWEDEDNEDGQESESNDVIEEGDDNDDTDDNEDHLEIDEESNVEVQDDEGLDRDVEILTDTDSNLDIHVSSATENLVQEAEVVTSSTSVSRAAPPASLSRPPGRQDRIVSSGRHQTLASFMTLGQFEEGDDRAVPSTPTLFLQNRRDDGFAEAVSSPQVTGQRFIFGSSDLGSSNNQSGASLSSQVTHMIDDTRMDLSQLEEAGTGRSVPSTPLQVSPPVDDFQCEKPSSSNSLIVPNSTVDSSVSSEQLNLIPIINVRTIHDEELAQGVDDSQDTNPSTDEPTSEAVQSESSQEAQECQDHDLQESSSHEMGEYSGGRGRPRLGQSNSGNKPMLRRPITWHSSSQYGMMRGQPFGGRPQRSRRSRGNFRPGN